jgi:hypothetical protein
MEVTGTKPARAEGRVSRNSARKMLVGRRQNKHSGNIMERMEPINVLLVADATQSTRVSA